MVKRPATGDDQLDQLLAFLVWALVFVAGVVFLLQGRVNRLGAELARVTDELDRLDAWRDGFTAGIAAHPGAEEAG